MKQKASFRYAKEPAIQILEMEYKGYKRSGTTERVSMIAFLPSERGGLPRLEEGFTVEFIQKGTMAAAATMVGMILGSPSSPPVFRADHPFIFLLRDVNTGIMLFIGKLEIPNGIV